MIKYFKLILIFIILSSYMGCKQEKSRSVQQKVNEKLEKSDCLSDKDKETIIQKLLTSEDLNSYVQPFTKNTLPIEIKTNDFITSNLDVQINGKKILFRDSIKSSNRHFLIKFPFVDCEKKFVEFTIWYEFEHASISGTVAKKKGDWKVQILGHGILD